MKKNIEFRKITPFIRRIPNTGGIFYTFSSASEDLSNYIGENSDDVKFKFSKIALLKIPKISSSEHLSNTLKLAAPMGANKSITFSNSLDNNYHFANSFQNYCLNLETMILSKTEIKNPNYYKTPAERVFFKWLKELGGIRFERLKTDTLIFKEENENIYYSPVVRYIGEIDAISNVKGRDANYTEVFINIPSDAGSSEIILFKTIEDDFYSPGSVFTRDGEGLDNEIIMGRKNTDIHYDNLDIRAQYDLDSLYFSNLNKTRVWKRKPNATGFSIADDYVENSWWFNLSIYKENSYILDSEFNNPENDYLAIYTGLSNEVDITALRFIRSKLDGITINFDINDYNKILSTNINNLNDLNYLENSKDFDFNAILLYYDLFKINENDEIEILATNLFGVLFLDNVTTTADGGEIKTFKKIKNNDIIDKSGNEFSFKINFKFDISNSIISEVDIVPLKLNLVSESNTIAMNYFLESLSQIINLSELFNLYQVERFLIFDKLKEIDNLEDFSRIKDSLILLNQKIEDIESQINFNKEFYTFRYNNKNVLELILEIYSKINSILNNKITLSTLVDLNKIRAGEGINLINNNEFLEISATNKLFSYQNPAIWIFSEDFEKDGNYFKRDGKLNSLHNYIRITDKDSIILNSNILINLFAEKIKIGMLIRIVFDKKIIFNNENNFLIIFINNKEVFKIFKNSLNDKLILELHCYDEKNEKFFVDILKN